MREGQPAVPQQSAEVLEIFEGRRQREQLGRENKQFTQRLKCIGHNKNHGDCHKKPDNEKQKTYHKISASASVRGDPDVLHCATPLLCAHAS